MFSGAEPEGHIVRRVISEAKSLSFDGCEDIADFIEWTCEVWSLEHCPAHAEYLLYNSGAMSWQGHCYHYSNGSAPVWIYSLSVFASDVQERVWMLSNALGSQENDQEEDGEWVLMRAGGQSLSGRGWRFCVMVAVMVNLKLDTSWGHLGRGNLPENALSDCSVGKFLRHFLG